MAPGNNERHSGHTGTIPKTKARNNCNVPQEAVTPTRRDMTSNLGSTSLDWVPVSEYNSRSNHNQSRKQTNNTSDQELTDLDNSVSIESGFGRFVPVRPQPRALPLSVQHQNIAGDPHEDGTSSTASGNTLHPYAHQMQNGLIPHSNHAAAAVMIVNPTTPNAITGNMSQPFNAQNQNRNNLTRNLNPARNNFEGNSRGNNNSTPPLSNSRGGTKTVNLINNMYEQQGQGSLNNLNDNNHIHRESARALGEAIVAACPDAAAVERRLGQIREYIRVTSSLVDTMRNSEDEQDVVVRPVSVQSNGSAYSENELWQNEIKNKMEMSQIRLATLKQQQKKLIKYQEEAKQQLEEMNRERQQAQEIHPSTSHDSFNIQNPFSGNFHNPNRMFAANQIGVATTLPHSSDTMHVQTMSNNMDNEHQSAPSSHSHEERFSHREANIASSEEAGGGGRDSEGEEDDGLLSERGRMLQMKLRELQLKKQHMENLMATRAGSSRNTYSSSGEDSGVEETTRKFVGNKSGGNLKNEDPFKLMEIKAIKTALQKTKDLMRSVENYEAEHLSGVTDDSFQMPSHSNIHDNKSEGGGSLGGWSNEGSVCRVRNSLPQRHKFTNEQHSQQHQHHQQQPLNHQQPLLHHQQLPLNHQQPLLHHHQQHNHQQPLTHQKQQQQIQHQQALHQLQQHHQQLHQQHQQQQQSHEANLASLQELAQELRLETEKIMGERARMKDLVSNKEPSRKQKKVNEEAMGSAWPTRPGPGPAERRQMQLRALLADKQRELEALLNKEKVLCTGQEGQNQKQDSRTASVVNQSYASEQEEPDSRSEQILLDSQNSRENDNYRVGGDSALGSRSINTVPSHIGSNYGSDSDSASRNKSNQRNRMRRRQPQDRQLDDSNVNVSQVNNTSQSSRHEARPEPSNVNMVPPISPSDNPSGNPYPHQPPPCWNSNKSNQDMRNQFTQNSHSQTMERLLGTPQMSFPPSVPFNVMMPYGMMSGCSCGCSYWGAWFWQQIVMQQREIHQLRDQLNHLEERWRAETASHTLNNQVPPGNRANNYWDNFRSYSRQNLLSANSKTNADGHLGAGAGPAAPLAARSHNALRRAPPPKRNTNPPPAPPQAPDEPPRTNLAYQRSLSFSSAPDVLNVNQADPETTAAASNSRNDEPPNTNVNLNRQDPPPFRNINIANPIPEIIQSHSNLTTANSKRKSSSKLPAKNSRRNYTLDYAQTSNINIASTSETPNPNLASTSREVHDKATSKLFDLLRENVYSEVTTLIGVNESHPDFLIQLFRELQLISSDPLRQKVLQSIRNVLAQYDIIDSQNNENIIEENLRPEAVVTSTSAAQDCDSLPNQNEPASSMPIDSKIIRFLLQRSEDIFSSEILDVLASLILSSTGGCRQKQQSKKRVYDLLSKYEGMRVSDVSGDIIESLPSLMSGNHESEDSAHLTSELSESSILQDVAGSLNLFSSSDPQLQQMNACPYDMWPGHVHMDLDGAELTDNSPRSSNDGKVDLLDCTEMHNGDLAEADQTCRPEAGDGDRDAAAGHAEALPDVVDTDEATPTEAEAEWLGLDRVPTRLHIEDSSEKQKD